MFVRAISALEIADFARWSAGPDRGFAPEEPEAFLAWLDRLWETGRSEPRLCLVVEQDDAPTATAVFWRHDDMAHVEHLSGPHEACVALLAWAGAHLPELGVRRIWAESVCPPAAEERTGEIGRVVVDAQLELVDRGLRLELDPIPEIEVEDPLDWRSYPEIGRGAFVDALSRCTRDTLDPQLARDIDKHGARDAAAQHLQRLLALDGDRAWWQLAYSGDGDLAGMVLPSMTEGPVLNFVGVVPQWRRRGIAQSLVRRGVATLGEAGATRVRADASSANEPMLRAFRRVGFRAFATRHRWERDLA